VIGAALAREKGWRVGDRITLESSIWSRKDGGHWDFDIVGIYDTAAHDDNSTLFLQQDYWEQGKAFGQGSVGSFLVRVMNPAEAGTVADKIDNAFANSPNETRTLPEKEYSAGFLRQLGDVGLVARLIVAVVAASMLLVVVSTMIQAVRERTPEFGVLRAIGYGPGLVATVILGETAMLCLLSAAAGFSSSIALFPHAVAAVSSTLFVSATRVPMETMFLVGAMAVALTLLSAVIPAYLVQRHRIVDSLTSEELRR
jgi:putative ABC transport system permease protein